ncbi:MAG TPA: PIN domain-containing protein [Candidatus Binataceae bacterium]|nr:PIN domain-containing protein [Candidatus Binataceae bacterium]
MLDTNVISVLMLREADPALVHWLDRQPSESVWTTAVTIFEIRYGLESLPPGRKRKQLEHAFNIAVEEDFEGRILPFDSHAARRGGGRPGGQLTSGALKSPESFPLGTGPWQPAIYVIFGSSISKLSILGGSADSRCLSHTAARPWIIVD